MLSLYLLNDIIHKLIDGDTHLQCLYVLNDIIYFIYKLIDGYTHFLIRNQANALVLKFLNFHLISST